MAKLLKNRTDNDIKNKWYSMKRTEQRLSGSKPNNPNVAAKPDYTYKPEFKQGSSPGGKFMDCLYEPLHGRQSTPESQDWDRKMGAI
jgi:hypothetical protein